MLTGSGRLAGALTLALAAALSVTACGSSAPSTPKTLPALSASTPVATPSPAASKPALSAKAAELAAATAVVRRYYEIANNLHRSMDADALAALFTSNCFCRAQVRAVRSAAAKGEHYIDQARLNSVVANTEGPTRADVLVDLNAARGGLVRADGSQVTSGRPQRHVKRVFRLHHVGNQWLITAIEMA